MPDRHPKDRYGLGWWITEDGSLEYRYDYSSKSLTPSEMIVAIWRKLEEIATERDAAKKLYEAYKEQCHVAQVDRDAARAEASEYRALLERARAEKPGMTFDLKQDIQAALARHGAEETEESSRPTRPPLGISPRRIWADHRIRELSRAVQVYAEHGYTNNGEYSGKMDEWCRELLDHLSARHGAEGAEGAAEAKVPSRPAGARLPELLEFSRAEKTSIAERYLRRTVNRLIEYLAARDGQED